MLDTATTTQPRYSVRAQETRNRTLWWTMYLGLMGIALLLLGVVYQFGVSPAIIAWAVYLFGASIILYRPRYGLYLLVFFTLLADAQLLPGFPFTYNFSSRQSPLFIHDLAIISPLEGYILLTYASWIGRMALRRKFSFYRGPLFWPSVIFLGFVLGGFAYGVGTGGNYTIALWESRAITYLPAMMILASNLLEKREHYDRVIWAAMAGIFVEAIFGAFYTIFVLGLDFSSVDRIAEHSSAIHANTYFVLLILAWLYPRSSLAKRFILPLMLPIIGIAYLGAQRRAAYLTLAIALFLLVLLLYQIKRRAFWVLMPTFLVLGLLYMGAFWNVNNALGLPAQAVKSVIAPEQAGLKDQRSNIYRDIENFNITWTIRAKPLTGVGFGQKFMIVWPMPDISNFVWWEYITHNSVVWIWMKTGVGGFFALLMLVGLTIMQGIQVTLRAPRGDEAVAAALATLYVVMHFTYAYADMSWDIQSMVYIGIMIGIINNFEKVVDRPVPVTSRRWPWQKPPEPAPQLLPLSGDPNEF